MKMRLMSFLAFALLSISILSYGLDTSAFADNHDIPPISASTELPSYGNGDRVFFSGNIRDYDSTLHFGQDITYVVLSGDSRVVIGQLPVSSDGLFEGDFIAGGPLWKSSGDYTIEFHFGSIAGDTTLVYTGGEFVEPILDPDEITPPDTTEPPPPPPDTTEPPPPPPDTTEPDPVCGAGTELQNGICVVSSTPEPEPSGGCLIATAAYGTELAPQVQYLREIRDNTVLTTASGAAFMTGFNTLYYSFAPAVADMERANPMFQDAVKVFITPMISTLSIMSLAEGGSEAEVLGFGISVIALNLGMYVAAPILVGVTIHKRLKSRN